MQFAEMQDRLDAGRATTREVWVNREPSSLSPEGADAGEGGGCEGDRSSRDGTGG
jgi:hypothetical protein